MALSLAQKFINLGMPTPLAVEFANQINTGVYNWKRLMWSSMVPGLAKYVVTSLAAGTFDGRKAMELSMTEAVANLTKAAGGISAFSSSKLVLDSDSADLNWVAAGDSTGNATGEWIYLFFAWLATIYPAFTFVYYPSIDPASTGNGGYGSPVTLQTGTGTHTFRLYNNSVSAQRITYLMGSRFAAGFITPGRSWDLVLWNYGKNSIAGYSQLQTESEIVAALAQVQLAFPNANMVVTDQYPNRDNTLMNQAHTSWLSVVTGTPQISRIDHFSQTYVFADYVDDVHLTDAANLSKLLPVAQAQWKGAASVTRAPVSPWLSTVATNYLDGNGGEKYADFSLDGNGTLPGAANVTPANYNVAGTMTFAQETTITFSGAPRSQKMTATAGNATRIFRPIASIPLAAVKGKRVCVTQIGFVEAGGGPNMGRLGVSPNGTGAVPNTTLANNDVAGGWVVRCAITDIPADATSVSVSFFHDTTSPADTTKAVYVQRASMAVGSLPRA